jgi:CRISPR-associated endonuclease Cas1
LHDIGCAFVQIDTDGKVIVASGPHGPDDARLRRAQALASGDDIGITITRDLLRRKLEGQAAVLDRIPDADNASSDIRKYRDELSTTESVIGLRIGESQAARIYWDSWTDVPVRFARKAVTRIPEHWQTFGSRTSPLTSSPRTAANPANAILNYLYSILESETRIALLAVGLDPGLGIVHADQKSRDNFALDVMEAIRPNIDAYVLELVQTRPFGTGDFFERRDGCCRLMPPVTRMLAETGPRWAAAVAPIVEGIAQTLMHAGASPDASRNRTARLPAACHDCGVILEASARRYCDDCLPDIREERLSTFTVAGPAALARRRAAGTDPAHGGEAGKARGRSNAKHYAAVALWENEQGGQPDPEHFTREILPMLQGIPLGKMAKATGLTEGYCSFVRRGLKLPHCRHWNALAKLAGKQRRVTPCHHDS